MDNLDLSRVHFFHYEVLPAVPTRDVQGGSADVCSIASDVQAAEAQALDLIGVQGFVQPRQLAYLPAAQLPLGDWEELELTLLAKARQRTPQVAAQFVVWGEERDTPLLTELPLPKDRSSQ